MRELRDERGAHLRYVPRAEAAALLARGVVFELGRELRLTQRFAGASVERRTPAGITHRQLLQAAAVRFDTRGTEAGNYHARRIAVWPRIGDDRAVLAGGPA